jgi:RNA polymerase sigma-70 factor (ECF subfamily)
MNDELLVLAAQSGDTAAFVELRRRHATKLLRTTYRVTRNWEDAEDALQDSFLKAYLHLNKFENRSTFASWLTRIAINSALMILRKKRPYEISIDATRDGFEAGDRWDLRTLGKIRRAVMCKMRRKRSSKARYCGCGLAFEMWWSCNRHRSTA